MAIQSMAAEPPVCASGVPLESTTSILNPETVLFVTTRVPWTLGASTNVNDTE